MKKENREYIPKDLQGLFIPYELAWKLQHYNSKEEEAKERVLFNTECIAFWNHYQEIDFNHTYDEYAQHLKAPMYQQVVDWFRENHEIQITIKNNTPFPSHSFFAEIKYRREDILNKPNKYTVILQEYPNNDRGVEEGGTYYEALNKAIEEAIKLI